MSEKTPSTNAPTSLVDLINKLVEPVEPAPISMVPQTGGWVVLAIVLIVLALYGVLRIRAHLRRNAYRKAALSALEQAGDDAAAIATILRSTALAAFPRAQVASLSGPEWLAFLDRCAGMDDFTNGAGQVLATAPYASCARADPALREAAKNWVRRHQRQVSA
ncbi:DUF4381 domain-containing protein [Roseobacter denitrificans]|uniref:DUF4381 domain-containing protein n=1 Tax=Roseobacter denitrificans (strain ATCC 33942 / OCh 114) TaxID=375451 RepID=Q16CR1_ROSDO|nr:DUF4381 domain-containing protein [Roseobacter denitrificans]ABG30232.1 hypothetical protein RD1_0527 [Roseobacter denitrificans OCh 114]AVL53417.1 DUF4381 domain-containing protein [Roseobacter denitrificans]SFF70825.1 Ca-activated chloride channel family protein [Roseobacter denitrificans OCh 114]